ncbi:MAG: DMT family transporter [Bacteroidales bacterium]|nr:DMT family transporter [Bacteroidales bacterium]
MKLQKKAYLFAFAAIACWSTIGSAFKITLRYLDPVQLLLISSLVACVALFFILLLQGKIYLLFKITRKEILLSAFLGLMNPFLYYSVLLKAYDLLQAQEAGTLNYIWPLVLVLLSIPMLRQKISFVSIVAIVISFFGIITISSHGNFFIGAESTKQDTVGHTLGVFLAVGSAFLWALYWIFNLKDRREAVSKLFLNFCFGFLYTVILSGLTGNLTLPVWQGLAGGIYIGLFEMGITFVLWLNALKYSSTTAKVSNLIYLSPFISLIIIYFAVGETILPSTVTGLALIIGGIGLQQYLKR